MGRSGALCHQMHQTFMHTAKHKTADNQLSQQHLHQPSRAPNQTQANVFEAGLDACRRGLGVVAHMVIDALRRLKLSNRCKPDGREGPVKRTETNQKQALSLLVPPQRRIVHQRS